MGSKVVTDRTVTVTLFDTLNPLLLVAFTANVYVPAATFVNLK